MRNAPNFDRIARPYRWLEYLALGPLLERTREEFLPQLHDRRRALLLGDGDGRFTARLLLAFPQLAAEAIDLSPAMLALLQTRCERLQVSLRLRCRTGDARISMPEHLPDLIVTHFFLDCLAQSEVDALVARLATAAAPGTLWLVSDFRIPPGLLGWPAKAYVRLLYLAFRLLTGLRTTRLPDYEAPLRRSGFVRVAERRRMFGMLSSELWQRAE